MAKINLRKKQFVLPCYGHSDSLYGGGRDMAAGCPSRTWKITSLITCKAESTNWKCNKAINSQSQPSVMYLLQQAPMTSINGTTNWGPSVQIHESLRGISSSSHHIPLSGPIGSWPYHYTNCIHSNLKTSHSLSVSTLFKSSKSLLTLKTSRLLAADPCKTKKQILYFQHTTV